MHRQKVPAAVQVLRHVRHREQHIRRARAQRFQRGSAGVCVVRHRPGVDVIAQHFVAIHPGDETIVDLHIEHQALYCRRVRHRKLLPEIDAAVIILHVPQISSRNERVRIRVAIKEWRERRRPNCIKPQHPPGIHGSGRF